VRLCNEAFILRNAKVYPEAVTSFVRQMLSLQSDIEAQEVLVCRVVLSWWCGPSPAQLRGGVGACPAVGWLATTPHFQSYVK